MTCSQPTHRTTGRSRRILLVGLLPVIAAPPALLGCQVLTSASSAVGSPPVALRSATIPARAPGLLPRVPGGTAITRADGLVPDGVTAFDDESPAVTKLHPALLQALRKAARDADDDDG